MDRRNTERVAIGRGGMRHPLHALCPYFAMFPEEFVARQLLTFTRPGDLVLDQFCGRGTTILDSIIQKRRVIGTDVNWVAACVAGAKAAVPSKDELFDRLNELARAYGSAELQLPAEEFFFHCFHNETLRELSFLRATLDWRNDDRDRFIAAVALGALHGESHRSPNYLSNRMPRTISTKPDYSVRWWRERGLIAERRETFSILGNLINFRLSVNAPVGDARVKLEDARKCGRAFGDLIGKVNFLVTSPPYLDTTDYAEDQWLQLWFLGGATAPERGLSKDDRHRSTEEYWRFLSDAWRGCAPLLCSGATIVIRIGGRKLTVSDLEEGLVQSLNAGIDTPVRMLASPVSSEIRGGQVSSFRPNSGGRSTEHDFVFRVAE